MRSQAADVRLAQSVERLATSEGWMRGAVCISLSELPGLERGFRFGMLDTSDHEPSVGYDLPPLYTKPGQPVLKP